MDGSLAEFNFHRIVQLIIDYFGRTESLLWEKGLFWEDDLHPHDQQKKLNFKEELVFTLFLSSCCHSQQKTP